MGIFGNKDKRANDNDAFNARQDQSSTYSNQQQPYDDSRTQNVQQDTTNFRDDRDDRAFRDNNNTNNTNFAGAQSQNGNAPDQRGGANFLGHQYQDPYDSYADGPRGQNVGQAGAAGAGAGAGAGRDFDDRYGTNTNTNSNDPANANANAGQGYSAPNQAGVHPYDASAGHVAGAGPGPGGAAAYDDGSYGGPGGAAATGGGRGGAALGYNNPNTHQGQFQNANAGAGAGVGAGAGGYDASNLPPKSVLRKDEWMGKLENAAGVLLSSDSMKQRGAQKELEAQRLKSLHPGSTAAGVGGVGGYNQGAGVGQGGGVGAGMGAGAGAGRTQYQNPNPNPNQTGGFARGPAGAGMGGGGGAY